MTASQGQKKQFANPFIMISSLKFAANLLFPTPGSPEIITICPFLEDISFSN